MKTLVVTLADLEDIPHGTASSRTSVDVTAHYTGPVTLDDGTIIPPAIKAGHMSAMGVWEFEVHASDSPLVKDEYRGFAVVVNVVVRQTGPGHIKTANVTRTVKVLEAAASPVSLGTLPPAEPVPAQFTSVQDLIDSIADGEVVTGPPGPPGADGADGILQTITLAGATLTLSDGGGSVTLPSGGGGATISTDDFTGVI